MRLALAASFALASLFASAAARADCALPRGYEATPSDGNVTVCATNPDQQGTCPRPGGLLRVDTSTGQAVAIGDTCNDAGVQGGCYVDECVPAGHYLYGYATPFACCAACCGTDRFVAVDVTQGCTPEGGAGPTDAGASPWDASDPTICAYAGPSGSSSGSGASSGSGGSSGSDAGPITFRPDSGATSDGSGNGGGGGGGCAAAPVGAPDAVLAIDGLALAVGLAFLARRRR